VVVDRIRPMMVLLYWRRPEATELNVVKLVDFMGGQIKLVNVGGESQSDTDFYRRTIPVGAQIIAHASTLAQMAERNPSGKDGLQSLTTVASKCLVYGFEPTPQHTQLLSKLTGHGLEAVAELSSAETEFHIEPNTRDICGHFSGLTFGKARSEYDAVFVEGADARRCKTLIRVGKRPFLVSTQNRNCEMMLLACGQIADVDETLPAGTSMVAFFSRLAPALMYLRAAGGNRCWQNDTPRACLILDDPLLQEQYGFLNYEKLLDLMERKHCSTSIAFIPWNYRRSEPRTVELFKRANNRYSLCVHGCDHTGAEFGATDGQFLLEQSHRALHRMQRHGDITGLGFDKVMVFPQGHFSTAAVAALKSSGYLAAVNSTPYPVDSKNGKLRLKDLMEPAITRFSGFPLFVRRYPDNLPALAFDLFLGRPALLVEHHGFFRNGYDALAEVVEKLNTMEPRLEWMNLSTLCASACLKRQTENGEILVRFYTKEFTIRNDSEVARKYSLIRPGVADDPVAEIRVNGSPVEFKQEEGIVNAPISLAAGETANVRVSRRTPDTEFIWKEKAGQTTVFLRRVLSEFRDNHVDKSPFLSRMASTVRNLVVRRKQVAAT
jgi:hypothetical protein